MKKWISGAAFAVALVGMASQAGATVLTPGNNVAASLFSNAGFTLVANTGLQNIDSGTFTATAQAWVYSDTNNSFCSGCLDFVYQVNRTGAGVVAPSLNQPIEGVNVGSFGGFQTNVGYIVSGAGFIPDSVSRSAGAGFVVSFNYNVNNLTGTQGTDLLVVMTDARFALPGSMTVTDSLSANANAFQPTFVPEPMTFSLMGAGLLGLGLLRKRISRS
jgi:hypothetical protein